MSPAQYGANAMARHKRTDNDTMVAYLSGLRPDGEVVRVAVYRRRKTVHLAGPQGSHIVHPSNEANAEGWRREAMLVWKLTDVYDTHPMRINTKREKEKFELLKIGRAHV